MTENGSSVALAACDVYRPAAVDQLVKLGAQVGADVYEQGTDTTPVEIARWALDRAKMEGKDVLIVDTAGRLHVDAALMDELVQIRTAIKPHDILLVVDAMTGQDAVNVAEQFAEAVDFDGVLMSKLDGDARGGAALSVEGGHRQADPVRERGGEARPARALPPRAHGAADPRHGRRHVAHREGRAPVRGGRGARARAQAAPQRVHARGLPRAAEDAAQDGPAAVDPRDAARARRASSCRR